ncbi:MAG: hypothetical protein AAGH53_01375 [Pseudomonadota bacterium]
MKTWMKVVLGIVAAIAAIISLVFWLTGDVAKAGDDFFVALEEGNTAQAYALLAPEFKADASQSDFESYLQKSGLSDVQSVSWSSRNINGDSGSLEGTATTKSGSTIPLTIELVKTGKEWKIYRIDLKTAGFENGQTGMALPSAAEQMQLVKGSTAVFSEAVAAKDMSIFHEYVSPTWKSQITPKGLEDAFSGFYAYQTDVAALSDIEPTLQPATIDENSIVTIKGYYTIADSDAQFSRAEFTYNYIFEGLKWRVFGHEMNLFQ